LVLQILETFFWGGWAGGDHVSLARRCRDVRDDYQGPAFCGPSEEDKATDPVTIVDIWAVRVTTENGLLGLGWLDVVTRDVLDVVVVPQESGNLHVCRLVEQYCKRNT
jgi:hypothetical protein